MIWETDYKTVLIEFKCGRCGKTHVEPAALQAKSTEGNLQCWRAPDGWLESSWPRNPLLCPECARKYEKFLNGEDDLREMKLK